MKLRDNEVIELKTKNSSTLAIENKLISTVDEYEKTLIDNKIYCLIKYKDYKKIEKLL